jgi:hypothetical protein
MPVVKKFPRRLKRTAMFCALCLIASPCARAATLTVTSANDSGAGSLREAMLIANTNGVPGDLIVFNISGSAPFRINLASALPSITEPVRIDGTSQPGYVNKPRIELNGAALAADQFGLWLRTSNCMVRGLAINRFNGQNGDGIRIEDAGGNVIQGNFIGTGVEGTNALGNGGEGIAVLTSGNLIGGNDPTNRNLISGNSRAGIYMFNSAVKGNVVAGNFIGTDVTGTKRLGNLENGVSISGGSSNVIGGTVAGSRNVISGNSQGGVYLINSARGNVVNGNYIGTDVTGMLAVSNIEAGVTIVGSADNTVGGSGPGEGNVISGNGKHGVLITVSGSTRNLVQGNFIGTTAAGLARLGNAYSGVEILDVSNNWVGGTNSGQRNIISGNGSYGVKIGDNNATFNVVQGNFIGLDVTGTNALGNTPHGVFIVGVGSGVVSNIIGGDVPGAGNVISGNTQNGVYITNAVGNSVKGNLVGTDWTGRKSVGNGFSGVRIESSGNIVGGTSSQARNVISGNNANGAIYLYGVGTSNNVILGNYIGTDVTGTNKLPNSTVGIYITNAPANLVGGTSAGARNVISGNDRNGIFISGVQARENWIQGNYIGPDATGTRALANGVALTNAPPQPTFFDTAGGIDIDGAPANLIGGAVVGAGNVISGNQRDGIAIGSPGASNNVIQGNFIGTQADAVSALGNEWNGIEIRSVGGVGGGANTLIGGTESAAFNRIAFAQLSDRDGIRIRSGSGNTNILVYGNSIFSNGSSALGLGIDLGINGVDANDNCDGDSGGNLLQNYPTLVATVSGNVTTVRGFLNSTANGSYRLQFYANSAANPSGYGEGKDFLGEAVVNTGANCTSTVFTVSFPVIVPVGNYISSTATDAGNNTSEFSADVQVMTQPKLSVVNFVAGQQVTLSWPSNVFTFSVQQTTNLSPPVVWTPVTNARVFSSGTFNVTATPGSDSRFYRLALQ